MLRPVLVVLLFLVPTSAWAGVWARPIGGTYARIGGGAFFGQGAFLVTGAGANGRFQSFAGELYTETGFGHGLEIDLSGRWVNNRLVLDTGGVLRNGGPEDTELFLRWGPFAGKNALSFIAGVRVSHYQRLPTGDESNGTPQIGQGGQDILAGFAYGHSFYPRPAWFTFEFLSRTRLQSPTRGLRFRLELGSRLWGPILAAFNFEAQPVVGRRAGQENDLIAPVPVAFSVGFKVFVVLFRGFGLIFDLAWYPGIFNDGPGVRLGLGVTYEFDGKHIRKAKQSAVPPALRFAER